MRDEYGLIGRDRSTGKDATIAVLFFVSGVVIFSSWPFAVIVFSSGPSWGEKATVLFMMMNKVRSERYYSANIEQELIRLIDLATVRCLMYKFKKYKSSVKDLVIFLGPPLKKNEV